MKKFTATFLLAVTIPLSAVASGNPRQETHALSQQPEHRHHRAWTKKKVIVLVAVGAGAAFAAGWELSHEGGKFQEVRAAGELPNRTLGK